jgi:predicted Co/Zn/Cd cation transporter (cation efflux family)
MTERGALLLSGLAALGLGGLAVAAAVLTGSVAILLDAAFNLTFFAIALVTLRVARLVHLPDDEDFPFGYQQHEPLINLVKALLVIAVSAYALVDSVLVLVHGGAEVAAGPALAYSALAFGLSGAVWLRLRRAAPALRSPLVDNDLANWMVNTAIAAGMVMAFAVAVVLVRTGREAAAGYIDAAFVIAVVLATIAVPIREARDAIGGLLNEAPDDATVAAVRADVARALAGLGEERFYVRVLKPGRTTYVLVHVLVGVDGRGLTVEAADAWREKILAALAPRHAPLDLDIVFTGDPVFAAPGPDVRSVEDLTSRGLRPRA